MLSVFGRNVADASPPWVPAHREGRIVCLRVSCGDWVLSSSWWASVPPSQGAGGCVLAGRPPPSVALGKLSQQLVVLSVSVWYQYGTETCNSSVSIVKDVHTSGW